MPTEHIEKLTEARLSPGQYIQGIGANRDPSDAAFFIQGFPDSSVGKESTCNAGDPGLIPESGRSAGEGIGYPLQYSGLENSTDYTVHGVAKSQTRLSNFHFHFQSRMLLKYNGYTNCSVHIHTREH